MASLPSGWERAWDEASGREFYINHATKQTSWTVPQSNPLPSGWEEKRDESGRVFYVDHVNQKTTWNDPRNSSASMASASYPTMTNVSSTPSVVAASSVVGGGGGSGGQWQCTRCTFLNSESAPTCDMCGTNKDGSEGSAQDRRNSIDESAEAESETVLVTEPYQLRASMVPDESLDACFQCQQGFSWRVRRHHCKSCGLIFCANCSGKKLKFIVGNEPHGEGSRDRRVCDFCASVLEGCESPEDSAFVVPLLRYFTVAEDISRSTNERSMALRGVGDIFRVGDANIDSATWNLFEKSSGFIKLALHLDPSEPELEVEACSALMASANANPSKWTKGAVDLTSVLNSFQSSLARSTNPAVKQNLMSILSTIGRDPNVQNAVREAQLLPQLCECLLSSNEKVQECATGTLLPLLLDRISNWCSANRENGNVRGSLLPFEFLQILVLLCIEASRRFALPSKEEENFRYNNEDVLAKQLRLWWEGHILKLESYEACAQHHDRFRRKILYNDKVCIAIAQFNPRLQDIYKRFATVVPDGTNEIRLLCLDDWLDFCEDIGIGAPHHFEESDLQKLFARSKLMLSENLVELKYINTSLTFADFLEALCRTAYLLCIDPTQSTYNDEELHKFVEFLQVFLSHVVERILNNDVD